MTQSKIRRQYNQLAAIYDQRWNAYIRNTLSFLKSWANLSPEAMVLDIACGTGEFERLVLADHPTQQIIGVDISEKMLAIAQQKLHAYPHVAFQVASASALPFPDNHFDVIVSANAFHYFDAPDVALAEMQRILKPGGKVIILDWCRDFLLCQLGDVLLKWFDPAHQQCYTQDQFHRLLVSAGLQISQSRRIRFGWVWGLMIATAIRA
jgi:ubiquinone/menaquinone biosynthesis C-methylase UbiE